MQKCEGVNTTDISSVEELSSIVKAKSDLFSGWICAKVQSVHLCSTILLFLGF